MQQSVLSFTAIILSSVSRPGASLLLAVAALAGVGLLTFAIAAHHRRRPARPEPLAADPSDWSFDPPTDEELLRATELESLGRLAGSIAHDFNNLLTGILGNTSLALSDMPSGGAREAVLEAETAARRAKELVAQILAWSGRGRLELRPTDLGGLVTETRGLLGKVLSPHAHFETEVEPGALVEADPTQLRQVVMNLLTNASDALGGDAGRIVVTVKARVRLDAARLERARMSAGASPGTYALLEVRDDGCGMAQETVDRMFEPFFTTKPTGRGLGLAALLGIVRNHRGVLDVQTTPGGGTAMQVWLPRTDSGPLSAPEPAIVRSTDQAPDGRLLLVEDEELVRRVASRMLGKLGFDVVPCEGGRAALDLLEEGSNDWTAAVVDVQMPDMVGWEVLSAIRNRWPALPVVLMTGYAGPEADRVEPMPDAWLRKPFSMAELSAAVEGARQARGVARRATHG